MIVVQVGSLFLIWILLNYQLEPERSLFVYPDAFSDPDRDEFEVGSFPEDFEFGTGTSAYQIEGAWNVDGKGPNIWDTWTHDPAQHVYNGETADEADKSYYLWDRDVQMLKELGVKYYRYSLSWSRILPSGELKYPFTISSIDLKNSSFDFGINWPGVKFYNDTINKLLRAGIEPVITIFHFDLPQALQDKGGQIDPNFPGWFSVYAELCFRLFGDRVKTWITFNEPQTVARCYEFGNCAPGVYSPGVGGYQVIHQQLLAHQAAWHIYDKKYRKKQKGKVGITTSTGWCGPDSNLQSDIEAAERQMEFNIGWIMSPLIGTGNYPQVMIDYIGSRSHDQGFKRSRLPAFSKKEQKLLLGATDFFALNYYSASICLDANSAADQNPSMTNDKDVDTRTPDFWPYSATIWFRVCPFGIRNMLNWVQKHYSKLKTPWYITENGYSAYPTSCDDILDVNKTQFLVAHVNEVYKAIQDGVNVQKYTYWSLMDNFEWNDGYSKKFGLYCVNFEDENRPRTARYSANVYADIIKNHGFENEILIENLIRHGVITVV